MRFSSIALSVAFVAVVGATSIANAQTGAWNSVTLTWTTPGDDSLVGTAAQFDIRYSTAAITAANFASATRWTGAPTPAAPGTQQTTLVTGLSPATTYYFAMKTGDEVPNWSAISNMVSKTTAAAPDIIRPAALSDVQITGSTETTFALRWTATGDDSLTGTATSYDVRYSTSPITTANWASATQATGEPAPVAAGGTQNYTLTGLTRQTTYYVAIKVIDDGGNASALSNPVSAATPDLTAPAAVRDLAVGFLWFGWQTTHADVHPGERALATRSPAAPDR
ncbi:MAG: fibronectin type III domain-containing protein [Candidatus Eisenbacteria bacterium]